VVHEVTLKHAGTGDGTGDGANRSGNPSKWERTAMNLPAPDTFPRRRPPLLKEQAFSAVKELIVDGTLPPGTFISEGELAETLKMSKTPIRSALERLAELGFISISPQRGIVVREMSIREVTDHYDIRMALESFVLRHVAGRLTRGQLEALHDNIRRQRAAVDAQDIGAYTEADGEFHVMMCEFFDNEQILRVMRHQRDKLSLVVERIHRRDLSRMALSLGEHETILAAVESGDGEQAAHQLVAHLASGKNFLTVTAQSSAGGHT